MNMKDMLLEVDAKTFQLSTMNGLIFNVEPFDITICCTWTPTASIEIKKNTNGIICINLENHQKVRVTEN